MGTRSFKGSFFFLKVTCAAVAVLWATALPASGASAVIYGSPGGLTSGACDSWAAACELRFALANAVPGQEIWVQSGTYTPTAGTDRNATFQLKYGLKLYGGFAGTETDLSQRDIAANVTILSGDIGAPGDVSDNSYHVVTGADNVVLDGFTITGGNANGDYPNSVGGGMYNYSSPTLNNCTFSGNSASLYGGGMYSNSSVNPTLNDCTFSGNSASIFGGGIYSVSSSPMLTNCTFNGNSASSAGGGMFNSGSPTLNNCTFSNNLALQGGGMFNGGGSPTIINCTFSGNSTEWGGGMYNQDSTPTILNSVFWGDSGGEIYNGRNSSSAVSYSIVQGGAAGTGNFNADPRLARLGDYGGPVKTMALLPGSAAIDVANAADCPATDQRGMNRPQGSACDMGAFESQGFVLGKTGGDNQAALINTSFASPLSLTVAANNPAEPVNGGTVTFTPPASGAGLTIVTPFFATIAGGAATSPAVTANGTTGPYNVAVATAGATALSFSLTNAALPDTIIDSHSADTGTTTAASFAFHGIGGIPSMSLDCSLDGSPFASCTSPKNYAGLSVGTHTFQVGGTDSAGNMDATPATYSWTVPPATTTAIAAPSVSYGGTAQVIVTLASPGGIPTGLIVLTVDGGAAVARTLNGGSGVYSIVGLSVGTHTLAASYAGVAGTFAASSAMGSLTITPPVLTISVAGSASRAYGDSFSLSPSYSGFVNGDTIATALPTRPSISLVSGPATLTGSTLTMKGVGDVTVAATGAVAPNYLINYVNKTFTVGKAALNVTAAAKNKVYGASDPSLTYTYSGLKNGDTSSVFSGSIARNPGETAGGYDITQGTLSAGSNYQIVFSGAQLTIDPLGLTTVVINPENPQHLIAGLMGGGVVRSTDGGATWNHAAGQPANQAIKALVIHPVSHGTIFAASYGSGVFSSTDSGDHWSACSGQPANLNATTLAMDKTGTLYAGTEAGIFSSSDCATWSAVNTGLTLDVTKPPVAIVIDPADGANLYAGLDGAGVFRSTNSGINWTGATTQPTNLDIKSLAMSDSTTLYAASYGCGVFKSENSGDTWNSCSTQPANLNVVSLTIDGGGRLYAGTEAGVFVSGDGCATWTAINGGLP